MQYLEALGAEDDEQKHEFSLTQHLAKNMIDLYINLPSNNKYRRPANYMSKGYQTRRMAVDYQIPLVTNVKNAKILVEAIARHFDLNVGIRDYQTSHRTAIFPGLINIAAFVPGLVSPGSQDLQTVTRASVAAGFSMIRVMPLGVDGAITDARTLKVAQQNSKRGAHCDFNLSISATSTNANQISHVAAEVGSLFIPFNHLSDNISKVAAVTAHFDAWPLHKPIVTDAKTTDLASILLLASLHNRRIHVTCVHDQRRHQAHRPEQAEGPQGHVRRLHILAAPLAEGLPRLPAAAVRRRPERALGAHGRHRRLLHRQPPVPAGSLG